MKKISAIYTSAMQVNVAWKASGGKFLRCALGNKAITEFFKMLLLQNYGKGGPNHRPLFSLNVRERVVKNLSFPNDELNFSRKLEVEPATEEHTVSQRLEHILVSVKFMGSSSPRICGHGFAKLPNPCTGLLLCTPAVIQTGDWAVQKKTATFSHLRNYWEVLSYGDQWTVFVAQVAQPNIAAKSNVLYSDLPDS